MPFKRVFEKLNRLFREITSPWVASRQLGLTLSILELSKRAFASFHGRAINCGRLMHASMMTLEQWEAPLESPR